MLPKRIPLTASVLTMIVAIVGIPHPSEAAKHPECISMPQIKPLKCVRGAVTDVSGSRVTNAKLTILQGDKQVATMKTSADGKFSFDGLEPGDYVLEVEADHLRPLRSAITIVRSTSRCRQALEAVLGFGIECDTRLEMVDAKLVR
jgi:hypothetical protein